MEIQLFLDYPVLYNPTLDEVDGKRLTPMFMSMGDETTYWINYELNGGYFEGDYLGAFTEDSPSFYLPIPKHTDYEFLGWISDDIETPQKDVLIRHGSTGDRYYEAVWEGQIVNRTRLFLIMADDFATYDIYLNGQFYKTVSGTFLEYIDKGTPYEIKNIRTNNSLRLSGWEGNLSGNIENYGTQIYMYFSSS